MMKISAAGNQVLKTFAPQMERTTLREKAWIAFLLCVIGVGIYALYLQITVGHTVTGMRDNVVWGIYIANFIFFIGISYAGAVISGFLHLLKIEWRKPIIRIAELITVIATIIGPLFILLCVGRLDRLHHLVLYARLQSPITWDVLAISTYLAGGVIFLYLASIKDFAIYRDSTDLHLSKWKRRVFKFLALNYHDTPSQERGIHVSMNLMALMIIPLAVIVHSVLSWIFGMTLRPGWHSTIFGPYFVLAAIYSGTGVLIIALYIFRLRYKLEAFILDKHFTYLGYIMLVLAAGYGYFTFSEYLTDWYGSEKWTGQLLKKLFSWNEYGGLFLFTNIAGIILPIFVVAVPALRKPKYLAMVSALMVLAMWVKRYLIVVPTLETPLLPIEDIRPEYIKYSITWVEWALTFSGIALFLLLFTIASKFMTLIPVSEISEMAEENIQTKES
ncbi:MAG: polysulfide reductase NrfD [Saprospiraceae bacterium]|uniref:Polysulfide reductase NrfD n=1 Tax=Candidatus Opimibacter skivensis TaxID=2982028 RepID=A0A9D7XPR9_9BACT|nr:polysulfide reductase NrfD [Candidatus Opimibacter skivensis]